MFILHLQSLKGHCQLKVGHQIFFLNALLIDVCRDYADGGRCLVWAGLVSRCLLSAPRPMLDRWRILWRSYGDLKAAPSQIVNILSNHNKWQWIVNKRDILNKLCLSSYFLGPLTVIVSAGGVWRFRGSCQGRFFTFVRPGTSRKIFNFVRANS